MIHVGFLCGSALSHRVSSVNGKGVENYICKFKSLSLYSWKEDKDQLGATNNIQIYITY